MHEELKDSDHSPHSDAEKAADEKQMRDSIDTYESYVYEMKGDTSTMAGWFQRFRENGEAPTYTPPVESNRVASRAMSAQAQGSNDGDVIVRSRAWGVTLLPSLDANASSADLSTDTNTSNASNASSVSNSSSHSTPAHDPWKSGQPTDDGPPRQPASSRNASAGAATLVQTGSIAPTAVASELKMAASEMKVLMKSVADEMSQVAHGRDQPPKDDMAQQTTRWETTHLHNINASLDRMLTDIERYRDASGGVAATSPAASSPTMPSPPGPAPPLSGVDLPPPPPTTTFDVGSPSPPPPPPDLLGTLKGMNPFGGSTNPVDDVLGSPSPPSAMSPSPSPSPQPPPPSAPTPARLEANAAAATDATIVSAAAIPSSNKLGSPVDGVHLESVARKRVRLGAEQTILQAR